MVRSFRAALVLMIVLAASLPVIAFSSLLVQKITTITSAAAIRELDLQVQSLAEVLRPGLDLLKFRLLTLAANRDVALATKKTALGVCHFPSDRAAIDYIHEFLAGNRLVVSMYLLDEDAQVVDAAPAAVVYTYAGSNYAIAPPAVPFAEFQRFVATLRAMGQHILAQLTALQQSQEQLAEANRTLEQRVAERTEQLAEANTAITALNAQLQAENLRMGAELEVTRKLQQMLLPTPEELQQIADLDIACYMEPADEVGGDYYDVLQHNGQIKIGIGNVTGHGLESGAVMVMTQTIVRVCWPTAKLIRCAFWTR